MANQLPTVELLGRNWFLDERLREFRSVANVGEPIVFFDNQEMEDMLSIKEILDNPTTFEIDNDTLSKLRKLFDCAVKGDKEAVNEIAKICNYEDDKNT